MNIHEKLLIDGVIETLSHVINSDDDLSELEIKAIEQQIEFLEGLKNG